MRSETYGFTANAFHPMRRSGATRLDSICSIAFIRRISAILLLFSFIASAFSQDQLPAPRPSEIKLPALANTPDQDRLMLKEIGDLHVFVNGSLHISKEGTSIPIESPKLENAISSVVKPTFRDDVWSKVAASRRIQMPDEPAISQYVDQYRKEAMWVSKILHRATPFIGHIVAELDQRYMPVELALLPAIESGYQPDVISGEEAAGIWQIVPGTANDIGVKRTSWFDGRADIVESTTAAIDYLSYLNAEFHGDWLLTLAAYNAGPGRVHNAINRNLKKGLAVDFWSLRLPEETRNYVPKFLALVALLRMQSGNELEIPKIPQGKGFDIVTLMQQTSINTIASLSGYHLKSIKHLNTGLKYGITPPSGPHRFYVPKGAGRLVNQKIAALNPKDLFTPANSYRVSSGDTLSAISRQFNVSIAQIKALNNLNSNRIYANQILVISAHEKSQQFIEYIVTIGDTLSEIAARHAVSIGDIRNSVGQALGDDVIHPGERLQIRLKNPPTG